MSELRGVEWMHNSERFQVIVIDIDIDAFTTATLGMKVVRRDEARPKDRYIGFEAFGSS